VKKLVYDPSVTLSYGLWVCPQCGAQFYGGERTMHRDGCPLLPNTLDYSGLEFHFGPSQVERAKEHAAFFKDTSKEWYGISVNILREQFPELAS